VWKGGGNRFSPDPKTPFPLSFSFPVAKLYQTIDKKKAGNQNVYIMSQLYFSGPSSRRFPPRPCFSLSRARSLSLYFFSSFLSNLNFSATNNNNHSL
jgi:hypothetical protein